MNQIPKLTGAELIKLFTANNPDAKAILVSSKLSSHVFIYSRPEAIEKLYVLQKNLTYKAYDLSKDNLYPIISKVLSESYRAIDEESKNLLDTFEKKSAFLKFINQRLSNDEIATYEPQLKHCLKRSDIRLDSYKWQIHFNNGYIDLKTNTFKPRENGKSFVTYCIDRDYAPSTKEEQEKIMVHIRKIYPDDDCACIISLLSRCLIGDPQADQDTLFLLGNGSSGKSFIMSLTKEAFGGEGGYVIQLQSSTFEKNNAKRDKILNSLSAFSHSVICWINEFSDKKIADEDFKNFCDGIIQTTKLYKDGTVQITLRCKLLATANQLPNLQINTGSSRRLRCYTHQSNFTEDDKEVNEKKRIFKKDKYLLTKIIDQNLLNAWVDILAESCKNNYEGRTPKLTNNFKDTTDVVISANDFIRDFIDQSLIATTSDKDRIGKEEMKALFNAQFPDKHMSVQQLISTLKEKGINYHPKYRHNNMQGCFICVKANNDEPNEQANAAEYLLGDDPLENGVKKEDLAVKIADPVPQPKPTVECFNSVPWQKQLETSIQCLVKKPPTPKTQVKAQVIDDAEDEKLADKIMLDFN
jgi:phage/plasmid-associated DNA primase